MSNFTKKEKKIIARLQRNSRKLPKITRESILAQMGHHRTSLDNILDGLNLNIRSCRSNSRLLKKFKLAKFKLACKLIKFGVIVIYLLWTKKIGEDDGDFWINY